MDFEIKDLTLETITAEDLDMPLAGHANVLAGAKEVYIEFFLEVRGEPDSVPSDAYPHDALRVVLADDSAAALDEIGGDDEDLSHEVEDRLEVMAEVITKWDEAVSLAAEAREAEVAED